MVQDKDIVGEALARVLPSYGKPWYRVPHLVKLNLILLVPLLSSAVAGYDGKASHPRPCLGAADIPRFNDERASGHEFVEEILQQSHGFGTWSGQRGTKHRLCRIASFCRHAL